MRGRLPWRGLALLLGALGLAGWAAPPTLARSEATKPAPSYAERVFGGLVPVGRVVSEREFHPWGAEAWDCTWAIVDLGSEAPYRPPTRGREDGWWLAFGGDWRPSPAPPLGDTTRDALAFCSRYWEPDLTARLAAAMEAPGSWVSRLAEGADLHLYSIPQGLAARIRHDD